MVLCGLWGQEKENQGRRGAISGEERGEKRDSKKSGEFAGEKEWILMGGLL